MRTSGLIIVGYKTRLREDAEKLMPEFLAPANYGEEAAAKYVAKEQEKWRAGQGARSPYTGELTEVAMIVLQFRGERTTATDVAVAVYTSARDAIIGIRNETHRLFDAGDGNYSDGEVRLVGHDVRTFAKLLGLHAAELGLPVYQALWYQSDYRDIESAVCPDKSTMAQALQRLLPEYSQEPFGVNAVSDAVRTAVFCARLGLFPYWDKELLKAAEQMQKFQGVAEKSKKKPRQTEPMLGKH